MDKTWSWVIKSKISFVLIYITKTNSFSLRQMLFVREDGVRWVVLSLRARVCVMSPVLVLRPHEGWTLGWVWWTAPSDPVAVIITDQHILWSLMIVSSQPTPHNSPLSSPAVADLTENLPRISQLTPVVFSGIRTQSCEISHPPAGSPVSCLLIEI